MVGASSSSFGAAAIRAGEAAGTDEARHRIARPGLGRMTRRHGRHAFSLVADAVLADMDDLLPVRGTARDDPDILWAGTKSSGGMSASD